MNALIGDLCLFLFKIIHDRLLNTIFKVDANDKVSTAVTISKHARHYKEKPRILWRETVCFDCTVLLLRRYVYKWRRRRHTDVNTCEYIKSKVCAPLQTSAALAVHQKYTSVNEHVTSHKDTVLNLAFITGCTSKQLDDLELTFPLTYNQNPYIWYIYIH